MKTVGEILKSARRAKGLAFSEAEKATKIRASFLKLLEKNEFAKIPGGAIVAKGFIKNYGRFLGLSPKKLLASFRRDFVENQKGQILPRAYYRPLDSPSFSWTPKLTVFAATGFLVLALFSYLAFQAVSLLGRPPLTIFSPAQEEKVTEIKVKVSGKTDPDAQVLVNGKLVVVSQDGHFETGVSLLLGENTLTIEAVSRRGKKTKVTKKVICQPPSGH